MKQLDDTCNKAAHITLTVADRALVKQQSAKLQTGFKPSVYTVVNVKGSMITAQNENYKITRNISFLKKNII